MQDLNERQPHIIVKLDNEVHVISIVQIRQLANGCEYKGEKDKIIQVLATALKDCYIELLR